ncbi:MAG: type I restriction enzyme HsdR N-terminal domain-containing protein [Bacteroidales bacterium]|nr:type I restriction enzyme HsdR N-terminal domain-containing protein [Bacteroidales bacterium]
MERLNLPTFTLKVKSESKKKFIFDEIRKKWIVLSPEEWVRQNFLHYLIQYKKYPASLLAVEYTLTINKQSIRSDIVAFSSNRNPILIVECKAPDVKITQTTFDQIAVYNMVLHVDYLVLTNGKSHYCCKMDFENKKYQFLKDIPEYCI